MPHRANGEAVRIDPRRLYSISEAASLIPSCRKGKRTHPSTLRHWIKRGLLQAVKRVVGPDQCYWFIAGTEILRLADPPEEQVQQKQRGPKQREREYQAACRKLEKKGIGNRKAGERKRSGDTTGQD